MNSPENHHERIVKLELLVTHLERDLEGLNAALLDQQKQLDLLRGHVTRLEDRLAISSTTDEKFDPHAERPPHY